MYFKPKAHAKREYYSRGDIGGIAEQGGIGGALPPSPV